MKSLRSILAGAALLAWPAIYNRYPILFSDTGGLLDMGLLPSIGWDKPFVYGPLIAALSLRLTLWLPALAQAALLSYVLWTLGPAHHLLRCAALALLTAAPWFSSTLMPDAFTPLVALTLIGISPAGRRLPLPLAGEGRGEGGSRKDDTRPPASASPRHRQALTAIAAIAIASHLSHLVLAAALMAALALLHRRIPWRPLASLAAALLFLLSSNWIAHGRPAISPYGSVFALARLIADGPARDYLDRTCPRARWALCPWRDQLTDDSDQFLWDGKSPFWADPTPLPDFAAQAGQIVLGTIRAEPLRVLRDAYRNAAHQLIRADLGDTLVPDYLADTVRPRLERFYPPAERARFDTARQLIGALAPLARALLPLHHLALLAALSTATATLLAALRRPSPRADLTALLLIALAANALSTGALSAVHDRYQARLAPLLLLPLLTTRRPNPLPYPAKPSPSGRGPG